MTVSEVRDALSAPPVPRPRPVERAPVVAPPEIPADPPPADPPPAPALPAARYPWPEPWGSFRGARPRSEFWDVETASWHSRGPLPRPRD